MEWVHSLIAQPRSVHPLDPRRVPAARWFWNPAHHSGHGRRNGSRLFHIGVLLLIPFCLAFPVIKGELGLILPLAPML